MVTKNRNQNNDKLVAGLAYILIGVIWYFIDDKIKKNDFVKFHVKQGLNLFLVGVVLNMTIQILNFISYGVFRVISWIFGVIFLILFIMGIVNVINNEKKEVPIIGHFASQYLKF